MDFKNWLHELEEMTTSSGDVAGFQRPIGSTIRRSKLDPLFVRYKAEDKKNKNRKKD